MNYLRIIATMDPKSGGPCQGIRNSVPVQKKAGIENEVLCFDDPNAEFLKQSDLLIHALGPAIGPYAFSKGLKPWLEENLKRFDVAIIHGLWLYNSYGTFKVWNALKKRNKKVPELFVMPHGMLDPYFQKARSRKLKAIRNWFFWNIIEKQVVNGASGLLFTCERELELARETFNHYKPKKELNVGYGIPQPPDFDKKVSKVFYRKCAGLSRKPFWLFLSRIHPKKGVDILVEAYTRLKAENFEVPELVIAGPGLDTKFGFKIREMGKKQGIYFPGMLTGFEKWSAFHLCEIFILPSHQENFGIAIVEAMACKKPVLITDKVNIWKEISTENAGYISKDNKQGVYEMLKNWYHMKLAEKAEISSNAFKLYLNKFCVEKTARNMVHQIENGEKIETEPFTRFLRMDA
ncbi:glycosyltransferase [Gramella sp. GC03-9]|uniref:Glycosyltransferase n=1 Tax=Christiangramia oceanisediminis TaxID=2920386 RepID=A0A9X2IB58_9FLAO|nr:glycosyltransferase [Gramella oceanisediminis]MCP9199578.1 glycosyltransferase [Gramella oceanisediminis]